ncbi:MAG: fibronectin type III domain-containing protein [Bacteroides sp.]|nr:fibronectin type III domain-containing protein [Eubacterium sp.]MCM1418491.1 fibronectin type III domain-containing protein [Roseburia sp.]MCM1462510.1 fibronectin type III domain-containing protein [Bacteroides sp.]
MKKKIKRALSVFLAAVMAFTMLFAGSVTAGADSLGIDEPYMDGQWNTEGLYYLRVGKFGIGYYNITLNAIENGNGEWTIESAGQTLTYDNTYFCLWLYDEKGDSICCVGTYDPENGYLFVPNVEKDGKYVYLEDEVNSARYYYNGDGDQGVVLFFPEGSSLLKRFTDSKTITMDYAVRHNADDGSTVDIFLDHASITPTFQAVESSSSSSKKESETTGKLPATAKKGTSMPKYTLEGYYTSKNVCEIVLGGIPEEEYEYLKACSVHFKGQGYINYTVGSKESWYFHFYAGFSDDFSSAALFYGESYDEHVMGEGKVEKNGDTYSCIFTFKLDSAAKKAFEKQIKKNNKMDVQNYYMVSDSDLTTYNYYNGKDSFVSQTVTFNFSDEIKSKTASTTLKTTTLTAKRSGEKIKFTWKKVDGAEKYQIYYREKGESKYKKLATVSGSKTSYTTSKLDKSKTYQFKIRSYKTVDGKKSYSKLSKVVTVK